MKEEKTAQIGRMKKRWLVSGGGCMKIQTARLK